LLFYNNIIKVIDDRLGAIISLVYHEEPKVSKIAPIVVESPQLQRRFDAIASEDLERKAGQKLLFNLTVSLQN